MVRWILGGILISSLASAAAAQNLRSCDRLIEHGISNITRLQSAEHAVVYKWYRYCRVDFQTASDSVVQNANVAVFGYGDGGVSSNTSQQRTSLQDWCDENADFASNKAEIFEEASIVSAPALASWDRCIEMARKDIRIDFTPTGANASTLLITIDSTHDGDLVYLGTQAKGFSCTERMVRASTNELLNIADQPKIGHANIHITCDRATPEIVEADGVGTIIHAEGSISVNTSGPALLVGFPEVVSTYVVTPPGAILAFQDASCPPGWSSYNAAAGRMLIGTGTGDGLTARASGEIGGVEKHTLTRAEMPSHDHGGATHGSSAGEFMHMQAAGPFTGRLHGDVPFYDSDHTHGITAEGGGEPHENMPPFLVATFCKRGV